MGATIAPCALSLGVRAALIEAGSLATQLSEIAQAMRQSRERGKEGEGAEESARQEAFTQCHVTTIDCPFRLALLTSSTQPLPLSSGLRSSDGSSDASVVSTSDTCDVLRDGCVLQLPQLMPRDTCCFPFYPSLSYR